jgi:hypothetical protein
MQKVFQYNPVIVVKFVLSELQQFVGCEIVDCMVVLVCHLQHIVHGIPVGLNITGNELDGETMYGAGITPGRQGDGCGSNDYKRKFSDLKHNVSH